MYFDNLGKIQSSFFFKIFCGYFDTLFHTDFRFFIHKVLFIFYLKIQSDIFTMLNVLVQEYLTKKLINVMHTHGESYSTDKHKMKNTFFSMTHSQKSVATYNHS